MGSRTKRRARRGSEVRELGGTRVALQRRSDRGSQRPIRRQRRRLAQTDGTNLLRPAQRRHHESHARHSHDFSGDGTQLEELMRSLNMQAIRKFLFLAAALSPAFLARADELADKGRDILSRNQHAVVTVQVVSKMKMSFMGTGNSANEFKQELTGTVVDGASGLTVLALSSCEP